MLTSRHTSEHQKHPYQGQLGHGLAEFEFSQTIINDYLKAYKKKKNSHSKKFITRNENIQEGINS